MGRDFLHKLADERIFFAVFFVFVFDLPFSEAIKEISLVLSFLLILLRLSEDAFSMAGRMVVLGLPVLLFSLGSLLSALHSINRFQALRGFWGDLETLMAWGVFSGAFLLFFDRMRTLRIALWALAGGILAGGLVGLYKMAVLADPNMEMMNLGDKNSSAQFLSMAFLLFLGGGILGREAGISWKFVSPVLIMTGGFLVLCHSRSFLVSLPVASVALLVLTRKWKALAALGSAMALAGGAFWLSPHLRWEMASVLHPTRDGSFVSRYETWKGAIRIFHDHPVLGVGPDTFHMANIHKLYGLPDYASHGHNLFFNLLGEYGLLGVLFFSLILAVWVARVLREKACSPTVRFLKGMTVAFVLNLLLAGLAHPLWGGSFSLLFMMIMALVLVMEDEVGRLDRPARGLSHSVPVLEQRHLR
ncbi:MAG: O-antigen ligase family protein [Nitrospirae bacterium]|nr:O-antigen ligase family protein [Nitrospirota bacterium]MCL5284934.1 O-antigen ligase family protein [Nitrospirota bacterium]